MKNHLKRLQIAADIVLQIIAKTLVPTTGNIFHGSVAYAISGAANPSKSGQELLCELVKDGKTCEACAKGSLIIARVMRFNTSTVRDLDNLAYCKQTHSLPEFSASMMAEIEALFERKIFDWSLSVLSYEERHTLTNYWTVNKLGGMSSDERMIHIMGLLIKNGGHSVVIKRRIRK